MNDTVRSGENKVVYRLVRARDGSVVTSECYNLRTSDGATWQANQMAGSPTTIIRHISLTSNTATPVSADTNLVGELAADGLSRKTGTLTYTAGASRYTLDATWQYTGGSVLTVAKAAIASAITDLNSSADTHFVITALSPVAVMDSNDTLTINWGIAF